MTMETGPRSSGGDTFENSSAMIVSSDGHAMARMADYRPYLSERYRGDFDDFLRTYSEHLSDFGVGEPSYMAARLDPEAGDEWMREVVLPGRLNGLWDPTERVKFLDSEGIAGEVLFPDFGTPFELRPRKERTLGYTRSPEFAAVAGRAHNRWLADYCATEPGRFAGLAIINFDDVDGAVEEIRWARSAGLRGIVLPCFDEHLPLYDPCFDPIWRTLADLEMPANSHAVTTSTTRRTITCGNVPHPACGQTIMSTEMFFATRQILSHFIWGGVLERHPTLKLVLTEQGSGWVPSVLEGMDYSYDGSYLQRDVQKVIRLRPSEYFERQVFLGSSIFSRAEVAARDKIGVDKMMLGMDYPHHEGTWAAGPGTTAYLQATLGVEGVTPAEAEMMLGLTAVALFGFDLGNMRDISARIGPSVSRLLHPPDAAVYVRGDVRKPLGVGFQ